MEIIRNLTRRKLRTTLTISGIVIGVLALVTMGAMAEKFNALLDGGVAYFGGNIQVTAAGGSAFGAGSVLPESTVSQVEQVPGVAAAFGEIQLEAKPGSYRPSPLACPTTSSPTTRGPNVDHLLSSAVQKLEVSNRTQAVRRGRPGMALAIEGGGG